MNPEIEQYNQAQAADHKPICDLLAREIQANLPNSTNKMWHGAPVWFLDGNPVVGYDVLKDSVRLLFWSGQSFEAAGLEKEGSFKAAEKRYTDVDQINIADLHAWLKDAQNIQWDYKNIVKRKGVLDRLK